MLFLLLNLFSPPEDGELDNLMLRALEKLHFFDGVLCTAGGACGLEVIGSGALRLPPLLAAV